MTIVRIGAGAGSWGDDIGEPGAMIRGAALDYLVLDYLAEITLSIMRRQLERDPQAGFASDFLDVVRDILPTMRERGTRVVTNAGGLNPRACAARVAAIARELGCGDDFRIAVVTGDDLMPDLDALAGQTALANLEDGRPFAAIREHVLSANAYLGAQPIRDALAQGADMVITGRCADVALTLGPLLHEHGWGATDWDLLAAGAVAGHLLECGAQASGGHFHAWAEVPGLDHVGYPIVEVGADGTLVLTKPDGSGGLVDRRTATEQLLHEVFDPRAVLTPDVTVDWTSIQLEEAGTNRVRLTGITGAPPPPTLKVSVTYRDGYRVILLWPYAWPDALGKARAALAKIAHTVERLGLGVERSRGDILGTGAIHGARADVLGPAGEPREVIARFAARTRSRADADRLAAQQAPMHYGPAGLAGSLAGGKGQVAPVYSHWPTTVPAGLVRPVVELVA